MQTKYAWTSGANLVEGKLDRRFTTPANGRDNRGDQRVNEFMFKGTIPAKSGEHFTVITAVTGNNQSIELTIRHKANYLVEN